MRVSSVLIVEDHLLVRQGLKLLLSADAGLQVIAEAGRCAEALELARSHRPDLVLLDLTLPDCNGAELIARLKKDSPESKVLVLTGSLEPQDVDRALAAGANGYVVKHEDSRELLRAIPVVVAGGYFVCDSVAEAARDCVQRGTALEMLTTREREILLAISRGWTSQQIAAQLFLSVHTVRTHRQNLMEKLGLHNVAELTAWAIRNLPATR